ncbi:MAG TPA: ABC transporter permease [Dehalococcoidales bacterium]|nr:ABC transporter permease [Dehalococcoidales bacterium]
MTTYIIRRLLMALIIVILVTLIVFFVIRLLPGDPLLIFLGQNAAVEQMTEEKINQLRKEYGLDKPVMIQYVNWINDLLRGDLGRSITYRDNVGTLLKERFPVTIHIGVIAFILGNVLGIALGVVSAMRRGTWIDTVATLISYIGITIPVFWLGLLMIYVFGLQLGWLPITGYVSPFKDFWESTKSIIMPVICLMITGLAVIARQTRSSMLEVSQQDYIRTAWSKGLRERYIVFGHMLKNGLIPVVTLLGIGVGIIFGGSVLVETVFAIPGVGRLLVTAVFQQDYVVVQSGVLVLSFIVIISNLLVDISYGWLDPRIRYS